MTPTYKIPGFDFTFKRVLRLDRVEGVFKKKPKKNDPKDIFSKVMYEDYDEDLGNEQCGVAIVVQGGEKLLYCNAFTNRRFATTWLYTTSKHLYKLCNELAEIIMKEKRSVEIYLIVSENAESAKIIAADIINKSRPPLN